LSAIESPNSVARKYTGNRRIFSGDDAALKARLPVTRMAAKNGKAVHHWKPALQSFRPMFGEDCVPLSAL
jgi:putative transposase